MGRVSSWTYVTDVASSEFWIFPLGAFDAGDPDFILSWEYSLVRLDVCYNPTSSWHLLEPTDRLKAISVESNTTNQAIGINGWTCQKVGYVRTGSLVSWDLAMNTIYRNESSVATTSFYQPSDGTNASCDISGGAAWFAWDAQ